MDAASTVLSGLFAGRYIIERELGHGATAVVYLARDQQRGHAVAIKVLRPDLAESVGADRFLKEIRLNQRLHHPHILPLLDSGRHDGHLFFVLPHMEGGTLRQRLEREKQLSVGDAVAITRTIANALTHAHEQGLVHRDVKPENILFTSNEACLGDFGIARALERSINDTATSTSIVRGTPPYMSPEQAGGNPSYDGRSDIYSLACVVYEMLAGMQPFVGPTPESVIAQRLMHPPRPLRVYRPTIPRQVEAVIEKALSITPADRFQTATEFADALLAASRAVDEPPRRRVSWPWIAGGVAALAAGAIVLGAVMARRGASPAFDPGDPKRIAVLYFDDLSPASLPEYVADGITEDLIDHLGGVRALHVISPNGVRRFRSSAAPLDSVRVALQVGTIVSGSVERSGNTVRVSVRMIDALSGRQLHSEQLEQPWMELFALKDRLADRVAFWLRRRLGDEVAFRERRAATRSREAWELAQRAGAATRQAIEAGRLRNDEGASARLIAADSMYAQVQRLDPQWAHPLIARARNSLTQVVAAPFAPDLGDSAAYARLSVPGRRELWLGRAVAFATEALRLDPRSAEALAARGQAYQYTMSFGLPGTDTLGPLAQRDLNAAVALRPDLAVAWASLAEIALLDGRFAEAAAAAERAYEADAFFNSTDIIGTAFTASLRAEQYDDARRWCSLGLQLSPGDPQFTECELTVLGMSGRTARDVSAAWRMVERIERADSLGILSMTWGYRRLMVAAILARSGLRDSAARVLDRVHATPLETRGRTEAFEAQVLLLLGRRDEALARLAELLQRSPHARTLVAALPYFRPLHGDPRFEALVRPAADAAAGPGRR